MLYFMKLTEEKGRALDTSQMEGPVSSPLQLKLGAGNERQRSLALLFFSGHWKKVGDGMVLPLEDLNFIYDWLWHFS